MDSPQRGDCDDADDEGAAGSAMDEGRPSSKRARLGIGQIAAAALEQWGLDEARVLAWAAEKGLPGVGIADLTRYRAEHPDEDVLAGLADLE